MQRYLGRTVLICEECGERLVLSDPEFSWHLERLVLECGCGEEVTLGNRVVEEGGQDTRRHPWILSAFLSLAHRGRLRVGGEYAGQRGGSRRSDGQP